VEPGYIVMKSKRANREKKKGAPAWATAPFRQFLENIERLYHVIHLSTRGISMLRGAPKMIEALMKVEGVSSGSKKAQLDNARKEADLAQREVDFGFPVLHAWAIVGLWAYLESLIRVFVASWLKHKRSSWQVDQIQRLRIQLGEYQSIPREQKHAFVAELLEKELGAGLKCGVTRFEMLLEPFGLSGDIPEILRRTIYEFGQVRNVIVHRGATVDRQFAQACPWLNVQIGTDLQVSAEMFRRYYFAAGAYVTLLICRVGEKYGVDMSENRISVEKKMESALANKPFHSDAGARC